MSQSFVSCCDIVGIISWKVLQQGLEWLAKVDLQRERLNASLGLRKGKRKQWGYSSQ